MTTHRDSHSVTYHQSGIVNHPKETAGDTIPLTDNTTRMTSMTRHDEDEVVRVCGPLKEHATRTSINPTHVTGIHQPDNASHRFMNPFTTLKTRLDNVKADTTMMTAATTGLYQLNVIMDRPITTRMIKKAPRTCCSKKF